MPTTKFSPTRFPPTTPLFALARSGNYFRSQITDIEPVAATVTTALRPLVEHVNHNRKGWVASDETGSTFWRADYLGQNRFRLHGPTLTDQSFGQEDVLRLWEYGVGDSVRQSTTCSVRRIRQGQYDVAANVGCTVSTPPGAEGDEWQKVEVPVADQAVLLKGGP